MNRSGRLASGLVILLGAAQAVAGERVGDSEFFGYRGLVGLPHRQRRGCYRRCCYLLRRERESPERLPADMRVANRAGAQVVCRDDEVRHKATRALGVLVRSNPKLESAIAPDAFIDVLRSGVWNGRVAPATSGP